MECPGTRRLADRSRDHTSLHRRRSSGKPTLSPTATAHAAQTGTPAGNPTSPTTPVPSPIGVVRPKPLRASTRYSSRGGALPASTARRIRSPRPGSDEAGLDIHTGIGRIPRLIDNLHMHTTQCDCLTLLPIRDTVQWSPSQPTSQVVAFMSARPTHSPVFPENHPSFAPSRYG